MLGLANDRISVISSFFRLFSASAAASRAGIASAKANSASLFWRAITSLSTDRDSCFSSAMRCFELTMSEFLLHTVSQSVGQSVSQSSFFFYLQIEGFMSRGLFWRTARKNLVVNQYFPLNCHLRSSKSSVFTKTRAEFFLPYDLQQSVAFGCLGINNYLCVCYGYLQRDRKVKRIVPKKLN